MAAASCLEYDRKRTFRKRALMTGMQNDIKTQTEAATNDRHRMKATALAYSLAIDLDVVDEVRQSHR